MVTKMAKNIGKNMGERYGLKYGKRHGKNMAKKTPLICLLWEQLSHKHQNLLKIFFAGLVGDLPNLLNVFL